MEKGAENRQVSTTRQSEYYTMDSPVPPVQIRRTGRQTITLALQFDKDRQPPFRDGETMRTHGVLTTTCALTSNVETRTAKRIDKGWNIAGERVGRGQPSS